MHYNPNQHYHSHYDYFDDYYDPSVPPAENRMITILLYLNKVEEGGQTIFPRADEWEEKWDYDYVQCRDGVRVDPVPGRAVIFYSLKAAYHLDSTKSKDKRSIHGGCDVIKGQKLMANAWFYNAPQDSRTAHTAPSYYNIPAAGDAERVFEE